MCGEEDFPPYSPCVIPFYLAGEPLDTVFWKGKDFYQKYRVTARLGDPVVEVDADRRQVRTARGRVEGYDRLFYAPGSRSRFSDDGWLTAAGVFGFKTLTDMKSIDSYISEQKCRHAVVFGGGFIGVDAALALKNRGLQVTMVHRNTRLLSQMTDEEGGAFATRMLGEKTGMGICLRTTVQGIEIKQGRLSAVRLADGRVIDTALLILATGVSPNSEPLIGKGGGVPGDERMMADPFVYAAGDVAVTTHAVSGVPGVYANYPNAMQQARTAARHLMHGDGAFAGSLNTTVLRKHIDFPVISVGSFSGEAVTWQCGDVWRRIYLEGGMINGYIIIGDIRLSGYLYQLYLTRRRVDGSIRSIISATAGSGGYREMLGMPTP
jgi:nitrite reductase (NADH) large subunit